MNESNSKTNPKIREGVRNPKVRQTLTIRLSDDGHRLLTMLSERKGIKRTAVLELLIRQDAKQEGLQ